MSLKIKGKSSRRSIELDGQYGQFYIGDKSYTVNYFSTFASPDDNEGGHANLLEELSPMRERVDASEMKSLDALLQRDLSDERIALELIPYLEGKFSSIGFFPPVLSVLMPSGFIQGKDGVKYPIPMRKGYTSKYSDNWSLELYPRIVEGADGNDTEVASRLGRLTIYLGVTDIIVIDGQHRSNAFRYVADCFSVKDAYQPFYSGVDKFEDYKSDLPVTIIWFESDKGKQIKPTDISRELFVAVNNSAKPVSESRTVLLDEVNVASLAVHTYYNCLADNSKFNRKEMNLLIGAFDSVSSNVKPKMSITDPGKLEQGIRYAFFGGSKYDVLSNRADRHKQTNTERFARIFSDESYFERPESGVFKVTSSEKRTIFKGDFVKKYKPVLDLLFSNRLFLRAHFNAVEKLEEWLADESTAAPHTTMWDEVFCGGEGLYHSYMTSVIPKCKTQSRYIKKIDKIFSEKRYSLAKKYGGKSLTEKDVDDAYNAFDTVAFQTGFLMFVDYLFKQYYKAGELSRCVKDIEKSLLKVKLNQWISLLTDYKVAVIGSSMDPNHWPLFQKIIVRLVGQDYEDAFSENAAYPDSNIIKNYIYDQVNHIRESTEGELEKKEQEKIKSDALEKLKKLNKSLGVKGLSKKIIDDLSDLHMKEALNRYIY